MRVRIADVQEEEHKVSNPFESHIAADNAFQVSVLGSQKQGAVVVQRFRHALEEAVPDALLTNGNGKHHPPADVPPASPVSRSTPPTPLSR